MIYKIKWEHDEYRFVPILFSSFLFVYTMKKTIAKSLYNKVSLYDIEPLTLIRIFLPV